MAGILTFWGCNVPIENMLTAIRKTDEFVSNGGKFNWYSPVTCPGALFAGTRITEWDRVLHPEGYDISQLIYHVMNSNYERDWYTNWEYVRSALVKTFHLEV